MLKFPNSVCYMNTTTCAQLFLPLPTTATSLLYMDISGVLLFLTSEQVLEMATSISVISYSTVVFTRTWLYSTLTILQCLYFNAEWVFFCWFDDKNHLCGVCEWFAWTVVRCCCLTSCCWWSFCHIVTWDWCGDWQHLVSQPVLSWMKGENVTDPWCFFPIS